jgi:hypothetical protein
VVELEAQITLAVVVLEVLLKTRALQLHLVLPLR